jgi:hypothetical protein
MSQPSKTRERLVADWRNALSEASAAADGAGSQAAWIARLRVRLYRFLLSLYGDGQWNGPSPEALPERHLAGDSDEPLPLEGKPAKSLDAIRTALRSVRGACEATPQRGPLIDGCGNEAWVVVASSSNGIDADKCGEFLKQCGIMPRVVHGEAEATVAVRSLHETIARRVMANNRRRFKLRRQAPHVVSVTRGKTETQARQSRDRYIAWSLLVGPVLAIGLWVNTVTVWSEKYLLPGPEVFVGLALVVCALTTLLSLLLHSVVSSLNRRY